MINQPMCCKKLVELGWEFKWDPKTRFVAANHPLGGCQSVVEVCLSGRSGFDINEIGREIALLLNGQETVKDQKNGETGNFESS